MSYKFLGENDKEFHIGHPDGSHFSVVKSHVSKSVHDQIRKFEKADKMFAGGVVRGLEDDEAPIPSADDQVLNNAGIPTDSNPNPAQSDSIETPPPVEQPSPELQQPLQPQASVPFADQSAQAIPVAPAGPNPIDIEKKANKAIAGAETAQANALAHTYGKYSQDLVNDEHLKDIRKQEQTAIQERAGLEADMKAGKIDPNRYLNSMGTGGKILTALGVFLGGVGGGDNNAALSLLKQHIENDVRAQSANMDKQKNLLGANFEKTRDLRQEMSRTTDQMLSALKVKVAQITSGSQSPIIKANAAKLNSLLDVEQQQLQQQRLAMAQQAQAASAGTPINSPADLQNIMNPETAARRVKVGNVAYLARSKTAADEVAKVQADVEPAQKMIGELNSLIDKGSIVPGSEAYQRATSLVSQLPPVLNKLHGISRLSDVDVHLWEKAISDPRELKSLFNGAGKYKNTKLLKDLTEKVESTYKTNLQGFKGLVTNSAKEGFKK